MKKVPKRGLFKRNMWHYALIIIYLVTSLVPLYWIVVTAIKIRPEIYAFPPTLIPKSFTLKWFHHLLTNNRVMFRYLLNSVIIASNTAMICLVTGFLAGYSLSRYPLRFNRGILLSMISTQMFPYALIVIPLYVYFIQLRLLGSYVGIIAIHTAYALPFCILILKNFCDGFPVELEDAAEMDGCGLFNLLFKVILPVIKPGMIAAGVYAFLLSWTEFIFGFTLASTEEIRPITPGLIVHFGGAFTFSWGDLMASILLVIFPILLIYIFLQRHVIAGLQGGALKR